MRELTAREALVKTLKENEIALVTGVYGDPCTGLLDEMVRQGLHVEISAEEKVAFAQALGASVAGKRSVVAVKQVGLNVLADPLVTCVPHGIGNSLLLIAGDDPGAEKSQNEQDSRWYAKLANIPVLTPPNSTLVSGAAVEALDLSAALQMPVMLQVTGRLLQGPGRVRGISATAAGTFQRDRAWKNLILDRYKYLYREIYPRLLELVKDSPLHQIQQGQGSRRGVISCGFVSTLVTEKTHFALGYAYPLPEQPLVEFLQDLASVLVVEEIAPIVEEAISALVGRYGLKTKVWGRLSGHLPRIGKLQAEQIQQAWERQPQELYLDIQTQVSGGILELPCGGFEPLYQVLDEILPEDHLVAGDVGCAILHGYFPPLVIDTAFALGTAISTAAGLSLSGRKGVAIIGDTGFVHSGITGLLDAVEHKHNVLVIILYNKASAMTPGALPISGLERVRVLVEACGVDAIDEIHMEKISSDELKALLQKRLSARGVHVLIAHARPQKLYG